MNAYIKKDTGKALWLIIEREGIPANLDGILGQSRSEDSEGNVAYALLEDELEAIKKAIEEYETRKKE